MPEVAVQDLRDAVEEAELRAEFPTAALDLLRDSGVLGMGVPCRYGGREEDLRAQLGVIFDVARASASLGTIVSMHLQQVQAVVRYGSTELRETVLPEVAAGRQYLGSVTTEAASGGDLRTSAARVDVEGRSVRVRRDAPVVTGGTSADAFLVKMGDPEGDGTCLVHVPRVDAKVDAREAGWDPMGMRESGSGGLTIDAVVPAAHVIRPDGGFDTVVSETFGPFAHLGWAATWLGSASEATARFVATVRSSSTLREKVTGSDLSLQRLARVREHLDVVHALVAETVRTIESGADRRLVAVRVNGLKTVASRHCFEAADLLVELGGLVHGYLRSSSTGIEKAFRDLRSASLNYSNDRLHRENGLLVLRSGVRGIGTW